MQAQNEALGEGEEEERAQPQTTIAREVRVAGIGLHSGLRFQAILRPAPAGHGRVFYLPAQPEEGDHRFLMALNTEELCIPG